MKEKCTKYQSLFVFRDSEEFSEHLEICEECRKKHEEMIEIESLIKFSKPAYLRRKKFQDLFQLNKIIACFIGIFFISFLSGNLNEIYLIHHRITHPEIAEYTANSIFNTLNLPTDEYGLLDADRNF